LFGFFVIPELLITKTRKISVIGIVPDLPELMSSYYNHNSPFRRIVSKIDSILAQKSKRKLDGYIFLTEAMNQKINVSNVPYDVIDGIVDDFDLSGTNVKKRNKVILYAGKVGRRFGVKELIASFKSP